MVTSKAVVERGDDVCADDARLEAHETQTLHGLPGMGHEETLGTYHALKVRMGWETSNGMTSMGRRVIHAEGN
jgi:hypothetical protein